MCKIQKEETQGDRSFEKGVLGVRPRLSDNMGPRPDKAVSEKKEKGAVLGGSAGGEDLMKKKKRANDNGTQSS